MIDIDKDGPLWRITLNRPGKANALTRAMLEDLISLVDAVNSDVKVLVLTGTGTVFSAGADLAQTRSGLATSPLWEQLSGSVAELPCLTIAAINGTIAGGAFGMALACDLRIGVRGASFFYPVMRLGHLPQPSDPARLSALVGPARAKMILLAGQKIDAGEALAWGLIDRVVAPEELAQALAELTRDTLSASVDNIAVTKSLIGRKLQLPAKQRTANYH